MQQPWGEGKTRGREAGPDSSHRGGSRRGRHALLLQLKQWMQVELKDFNPFGVKKKKRFVQVEDTTPLSTCVLQIHNGVVSVSVV